MIFTRCLCWCPQSQLRTSLVLWPSLLRRGKSMIARARWQHWRSIPAKKQTTDLFDKKPHRWFTASVSASARWKVSCTPIAREVSIIIGRPSSVLRPTASVPINLTMPHEPRPPTTSPAVAAWIAVWIATSLVRSFVVMCLAAWTSQRWIYGKRRLEGYAWKRDERLRCGIDERLCLRYIWELEEKWKERCIFFV